MKYLRWIISLIVLIYAGYIAFPVIKNMMFPTYEPEISTRSADSGGPVGGMAPTTFEDYGAPIEVPAESIQGETAVVAMETGNMPVLALWGGVVGLYIVSALLLTNGNLRAALAYGAAFLADVVLTFLTKGQAGSGIFDRIIDVLSGWDPRYTITLIALVLGFVILMARERPLRRRRLPDLA
jgi:hypothetical protein